MPLGLCNALTTFQKVVTKIFSKYLNEFMQVFFDNYLVKEKIIWHNYKNVYMNVVSMA
jgi:hypothetical protein